MSVASESFAILPMTRSINYKRIFPRFQAVLKENPACQHLE